MTGYILVKYLHFVGIFGMLATLIAELVLVRPSLTTSEVKRISIVDGIYGFSAILAVGAGFALWFAVGKPASFYSSNPVFHSKLALAVLVGIISIYPTVFFIKNRKGAQGQTVMIPGAIRKLILIQIVLLFCIPVLAVIMALGMSF